MNTPFASPGWNEPPHLYGVIVHEDPLTELRGRRQWDHLAHEFGHGIRCSATCQPAEQIKHSLIFEQAYQVDVVIVSVHDLACFLFDASEWLTDWLNITPRLPRALFILHDGNHDGRAMEILGELARLGGVTLFTRGRENPAGMPAGAILTFAETWFRTGASRGFRRGTCVPIHGERTSGGIANHDVVPSKKGGADFRNP